MISMKTLSAFSLGFVAAVTVRATVSAQTNAPWPTKSWATSSPAAHKVDSAPIMAFHRDVESGKYGNIDRLVVIRNGYLLINQRYPRDYRAIGKGKRSHVGCGEGACSGFTSLPEFNYFDPEIHPFYRGRPVHTLQSVTKSMASTMIGAAIQTGAIKSMNDPLLSFLGGYRLDKVEPRLRRATLADLLTMRTGIEWHEQDRPLDSTNTTAQLEASKDWVQFTLDQPMDADPGTKWAYNSGGSHLMSAVIRTASGTTIDKFAEKNVFGPLGITDYHWKLTPTGLPDTEGGLYLEALDLAKIGYLYLRNGEWDGRRILPESWAKSATSRLVQSVNQAGFGYGYQWWRPDQGSVEVWAGMGFGGQYLLVLPQYQLIGVLNSWNVFGEQVQGSLLPFLRAMIASVGGPAK